MLAEIRGHQRGDVLDYVNETEETIPAMTVLRIGSRIGIAAGDIEPGALGAVYVEGVFYLPKTAAAIEAWADVAWTETGVAAASAAAAVQADDETSESGTGDAGAASGAAAGFAIKAAAADDTHVAVKLNA